MCSQAMLHEILGTLRARLSELLGTSMKEMILFGSYARNGADDGSDVDVMVLSDMSRQEIATLNWQLGEITSDILLDYGVLISPIIENELFFTENTQALPFFRRIHDEGIRINT